MLKVKKMRGIKKMREKHEYGVTKKDVKIRDEQITSDKKSIIREMKERKFDYGIGT